MIATELTSLIELLRDLAQRKNELDKEYFENFIQPAWDAFVRVHDDYIRSLKTYQESIEDDRQSISKLMEIMQRDLVSTSSLRSELEAAICTLPREHLDVNSDMLNFVRSIELYLNKRMDLSIAAEKHRWRTKLRISYTPEVQETFKRKIAYAPPEQYVRRPLIAYLSRKVNETNRSRALKVFEIFAVDLQRKYDNVVSAYYALKTDLLT